MAGIWFTILGLGLFSLNFWVCPIFQSVQSM